jgi:hypothetical protein
MTLITLPEGRFLVPDVLAPLVREMQRASARDLAAGRLDRHAMQREILYELLRARATPVPGTAARVVSRQPEAVAAAL